MNTRLFSLLVMLLMCQASLAGKDIYYSIDESGNPVFSDTPRADSEKIQVEEIQTIPAETPKFEYQPKVKELPRYTTLLITSPEHDSAVRDNAGNVTVEIKVEPKLREKDILRLYLDNQVVQQGTDTTFELTNLDRGTHQLSVAVIGQEGDEIKRSSDITFHLLRVSTLDPGYPGLSPDPVPISPLNPPKPPAPPVSPVNPPKPPAPPVSPVNPPKPPAP